MGVVGANISADLYIACGVSGDIYHYYGVQNVKYVVSINTDENAPIMKVANLCVVGDAREVIPVVIETLKA